MIRNRTHQLQTQTYQLMLNGFDKKIQADGYRQTSKTYQNNAKEFLYYLECNGKLKINNLTALDLIDYYEYISTRNNHRSEGVLSSSTISQHFFAIDLLFDYLINTGQMNKNLYCLNVSEGMGNKEIH